MRDHKPIKMEEFNGLWKRGDPESAPLDHFTDCNNIQYIESGFKTRDGISFYLGDEAAPEVEILRIHPYTMQDRLIHLFLTTDGKIFRDDAPSIGGEILTIVGMTDFNCVSIAG